MYKRQAEKPMSIGAAHCRASAPLTTSGRCMGRGTSGGDEPGAIVRGCRRGPRCRCRSAGTTSMAVWRTLKPFLVSGLGRFPYQQRLWGSQSTGYLPIESQGSLGYNGARLWKLRSFLHFQYLPELAGERRLPNEVGKRGFCRDLKAIPPDLGGSVLMSAIGSRRQD